jgi:hypothetical protein
MRTNGSSDMPTILLKKFDRTTVIDFGQGHDQSRLQMTG